MTDIRYVTVANNQLAADLEAQLVKSDAWHAHPVRTLEARALERHAPQVGQALAAMLPRAALIRLIRAFLDQR